MSRWDDPTRGWDEPDRDRRPGDHATDGVEESFVPPGQGRPVDRDAETWDSGRGSAPIDQGARSEWGNPEDAAVPAAPQRRDGFHAVGPGGVPELWPGPIPLRPLGFFEIIETAFRVLRFNPRTIFGVTFVVLALTTVVALIVFFALGVGVGRISGFAEFRSTIFDLSSWVTALASFLLSGFLIVPIAEAALGRRLTGSESWARMKGRILPLIGYGVLSFFIQMLAIVPGIALAVAGGLTGELGLMVTGILGGILLAIVLFVVAMVFLSVGPAALMLERIGPVAAIRRSFTLVKGAFWRILGLVVIVGIGVTIATVAVMMPVMIVLGLAAGAAGLGVLDPNPGLGPAMAIAAVGAALNVLISTLLQPLYSAVYSLVYLDRRFRTEALAVDLLAEAERG